MMMTDTKLNTEIRKIKTEQAWQRLHTRLDKDHLLSEVIDTESTVVHNSSARIRYAAVAAVLVGMVLGAVYFMVDFKGDTPSLVTQRNRGTSTLVATLEDGSLVLLAGETSLLYPEHFIKDKRQVDLRGNAFFDIARKKGQPFLIETEQVSIEVLGTAFNVQSNEAAPFSLSVQRGLVRVSLKKNKKECYVKAGETVTIRSQQFIVASTDKDHLNSYFKHIRFKDETLANILKVMNLNAGASQIYLASPSLGERKLTVEFSDEPSELVARLIAGALGVECIRQGKALLLKE